MLRLSFLILAVMLAAAMRPQRRQTRPERLLPYQVRFRSLPVEAQGVFRELLAALETICELRAETGAWPLVRVLAREALPPFVPVVLASGEHVYEFGRTRRGGAVFYFGRRTGAPLERTSVPGALLVVLVESRSISRDPSHRRIADSGPGHRRLADGTVVHLWLWFHPDPVPRLPMNPPLEGWRQMVSGAGRAEGLW